MTARAGVAPAFSWSTLVKRLSWCFGITTMLCSPVARADTEVRLDLDTHVEATTQRKSVPPDSHTALTVTLGERSFTVRSPDNTIVYDFDRRKYFVVDPRLGTRVEYSTYDHVGLRLLELRNRANIAKALAAAKIENASLRTMVENEHALAVQEVPSQPLRVDADSSDRTFASDARLLARISLDGTAVSPSDARMFAQFVRYRVAAHPQVLAALASADRIPARLVVARSDPGDTTQTLTIRAVGPARENAVDLAKLRLRAPGPGSDPIDAILDRGAKLTAQQLEEAGRKSEDDVAVAFRDGRVLDALLGSLERNSITGAGLPALTADQKTSFQTDPAARKFLSIIGAKRKDDLLAAIAVLDELRPLTSKTGIIDLTKANDLAMLGKRVEARTLFIAVLDANPCLGGAYKDLGDALLGGWDVPRAWRSWDVGRSIAPRFPSYTAVDQFERSLAAGHPEYF